MRTSKRSVELKILEALKDYQWRRSSPMLHFAMHINHSEGYVLKQLKDLIAKGKVKRIRGDAMKGKPYFTYKLVEQKHD